MNPWLLGGLSFLAGAAAGSGGTWAVLKEKGMLVPAPSQPAQPVKK